MIIGVFAVSTGAIFVRLADAPALIGSICAAIYLLLGRNLRRKLSLLPYIFICYGSAAVILWVMVLCLRLPLAGFSQTTFYALWAWRSYPS